MADGRDALPLERGGGGEQGAGAAEEQAPPAALLHTVEQKAGEHRGGAAAARAAAVDVLGLGVVDEHAAVLQIFEFNAVPVEEIQQNLLAQAAQIAGDNQIIVRGPAACVPKMGLNGIIGGG